MPKQDQGRKNRRRLQKAPPLLLLLLLTLGACRESEESASTSNGEMSTQTPSQHKNLIIVSYDTVRADHLSLYGNDKITSPTLDRFAFTGLVFDHAYTTDTNTNPAHTSLLTGLHPHQHGNRVNGHLLRDGVTTLAEVLQAEGYATAAFVGGAPMRAEASGLDRGFDTYDDAFEGSRRAGSQVLDRALAWRAQQKTQPSFLFLHLYDAHGPYLATEEELIQLRESPAQPAGSPSNHLRTGLSQPVTGERIPPYQRLKDAQGRLIVDLPTYIERYDALLLRLDGLLQRLLQHVDLESSYILVVADHGETLDERSAVLDHGGQLFEEQTRIPFVLLGSGLAEPAQQRDGAPMHVRDSRLVSLIDVVPTLLPLLSVEWPGGTLPGSNLLAPGPDSTTVLTTARADTVRHRDRGYQLVTLRRLHALKDERWKLIQYPGREGDYFELYDLASDPGERHNVAEQEPAHSRRLFRKLQALHPAYETPIDMVRVSDALREQLQSLGYLD